MRRAEVGKAVKENTSSGGDYLDLKTDGKAVIHIHGNLDVDETGAAEIEERYTYWVPANPDADFKPKGKKNGGHKRRFVAGKKDANPFQDLLDALEAAKEISGDEVILYADGETYTKDEILGKGDWNKDCRGGYELLYAVVASSIGDEQVSDPKLQILACKPSLATAIDKVIQVQVRENGAEKGEASKAMYGIEIEYDDGASPSKKYTAQFNGRKPPPRVRKLLEGAGLDLLKYCGPPDENLLTEIIEDTLVIRIPGLDIEPLAEYEPQPRRETRGRGGDRGRDAGRGGGREDRRSGGGDRGRDQGRGGDRDAGRGRDTGRGGSGRGKEKDQEPEDDGYEDKDVTPPKDEKPAGRQQERGRDSGRGSERTSGGGKGEDRAAGRGRREEPAKEPEHRRAATENERRAAEKARRRRDAEDEEEASSQLPGEGGDVDDPPMDDDAIDAAAREQDEDGYDEEDVSDPEELTDEDVAAAQAEQEPEPEGNSAKVQCPECHKMTTVSAKQKKCTHCGALVIPF